jgi:hypothetical protein
MSEEIINEEVKAPKPKGRPKKKIVETVEAETPVEAEVVVEEIVEAPAPAPVEEVQAEVETEVVETPEVTEAKVERDPKAAENKIRQVARGIQERDTALKALRSGYTVYLNNSNRIVITNYRDARNGKAYVARLNPGFLHINSL